MQQDEHFEHPLHAIQKNPSKCLEGLNNLFKKKEPKILDLHGLEKVTFHDIPQPYPLGSKPKEENPFCKWVKLTKRNDGKYWGKPYKSKDGKWYVLMPIEQTIAEFVHALISELERRKNEITS